MEASSTPGVINANELYILDEFKARMRLGSWAMRQARQGPDGLRVHKIGLRKYVKGSDVLAYLDRQAEKASQ